MVLVPSTHAQSSCFKDSRLAFNSEDGHNYDLTTLTGGSFDRGGIYRQKADKDSILFNVFLHINYSLAKATVTRGQRASPQLIFGPGGPFSTNQKLCYKLTILSVKAIDIASSPSLDLLEEDSYKQTTRLNHISWVLPAVGGYYYQMKE